MNVFYITKHKLMKLRNDKYLNALSISKIHTKFENNKVFYIETKSCELPKLVDDEETIENLHQDTRKASDKKGSITRIGQSEFRAMIFKQYSSRCVVTGTSTAAVLQAAHIYPYRGNHSHQPWNGLLLRSDIHALFDSHELTLVQVGELWKVRVNTEITDRCYLQLDGKTIKLLKSIDTDKLFDVLNYHNGQCEWLSRLKFA